MLKILITAIAATSLMITGICADEQKSANYRMNSQTTSLRTSGTVAVINGEEIKESELVTRLLDTGGSQALASIIEERLILQEANKKKVSVSDKDIEEQLKGLVQDPEKLTPKAKDMLSKRIRIWNLRDKMVTKAYGIKVPQKELMEFFEQNKDSLSQPEKIRVRNILTKNEDEANEILIALKAGADFSKLAQLKSQDNITRSKGGDMGYVTKGISSPVIEKEVLTLPAGNVSKPIKTDTGYQIFYIEEKVPAKEADFKEVKDQIKKFLTARKINEKYPLWLKEVQNSSDIKILKQF